METRLGNVAIIVNDTESVQKVNQLLSEFSSIILGRMGLPMRNQNIQIITLIIEGTTDEIGALTGKLGTVKGVQVKSMLAK